MAHHYILNTGGANKWIGIHPDEIVVVPKWEVQSHLEGTGVRHRYNWYYTLGEHKLRAKLLGEEFSEDEYINPFEGLNMVLVKIPDVPVSTQTHSNLQSWLTYRAHLNGHGLPIVGERYADSALEEGSFEVISASANLRVSERTVSMLVSTVTGEVMTTVGMYQLSGVVKYICLRAKQLDLSPDQLTLSHIRQLESDTVLSTDNGVRNPISVNDHRIQGRDTPSLVRKSAYYRTDEREGLNRVIYSSSKDNLPSEWSDTVDLTKKYSGLNRSVRNRKSHYTCESCGSRDEYTFLRGSFRPNRPQSNPYRARDSVGSEITTPISVAFQRVCVDCFLTNAECYCSRCGITGGVMEGGGLRVVGADGVGYTHSPSFTPMVTPSGVYCDECWSESSVVCDASGCDTEMLDEYARVTRDTSDFFCPDCAEDFYSCYDCGDSFRWEDNLVYNEWAECYYCSSCSESHASRHIHSYSTNVLNFLDPDPLPKCERLYGVELEVGWDNTEYRSAPEELYNLVQSDAILKDDSSIYDTDLFSNAGGAEIVTRPMTYENQIRFWKSTLDNMPGYIRSYDMQSCGLHIHVTKKKIRALTLGKLLVFINDLDNKPLIQRIAKRYSESGYARRKDKQIKDGKYPGMDRYDLVNTSNNRTIEFRLYRGTVNRNRFLSCLEFTRASIEFCEQTSMNALHEDDFIKWLMQSPEYTTLKTYLKLIKPKAKAVKAYK